MILERLATLVDRRTVAVLAAALVVVTVSIGLGGKVPAMLTSGGSPVEDPDSESIIAREELEARSGSNPDFGVIALVRADRSVRDPAVERQVERVAERLARDPAVGDVSTLYTTNNPGFVSRDGRSTFVAASLKRLSADEEADAGKRIEDLFSDDEQVLLGGPIIASEQINSQIQEDLAKAEAIAFPILFLLSLFIFRGVVAAFLPILTGAIAIFVTFGAMRVLNEVVPLSVFAINLVTAVGLGLAIDYSLFIVSRYREELERGEPAEALRRTLTTAGRTVSFSALTVGAALASLLIFPQPFLYSMGAGGVLIALASLGSAVIVLPAILALLGPRVNALAPERWRRASQRTARGVEQGFWYRLAHAVMRRPGIVAVGATAFMLALSAPTLGINFVGVDAAILPTSASARQVDDALEREFPTNGAAPIYVSLSASQRRGVEEFAASVRELPGAAAVAPPRRVAEELWRVDVIPAGGELDEQTIALVDAIRAVDTPLAVRAGGQTANFVDQRSSTAAHLPLAITILVVTTLILLFLMTGSVLLPIKAIVMNVLTLGAAFGVVVLIFQHGRLEGLLDYTSLGGIDLGQPVLIAATAFALSTDYAVFLLSRIKEARDQGMTNEEAVAFGLERTGRIVTAAALLFAVAVGAFATSDVVIIKETGIGIVLAVILDATIVRALLVPALMRILGDWNWWSPAWLRRAHERFGISEAADETSGR